MEKGKKNEELFCSMPVPQAILALAVPLSMKFGKKSTYIISLVCLVVLREGRA